MTSGCPGQPQFGFEGALPAQGRWLPEGDTSPGFIVETDSVAVCLSHSPRVDRGPRRGSKVCCHTARGVSHSPNTFLCPYSDKGSGCPKLQATLACGCCPPPPGCCTGWFRVCPQGLPLASTLFPELSDSGTPGYCGMCSEMAEEAHSSFGFPSSLVPPPSPPW